MIQFDLPKQKSSIIKVLGVGGGGSNAVNFMFQQDIEGVDFIICNTDSKAIENSPVPNKIQLGPHLTQGLGAGADPSVGKLATEESLDEIKKILEVNTRMAFITVGMGGGTGTGGAPIIAKICKDLGILTVGIVTTPFGFEGPRRQKQAEEGINQLKPYVDTLLVISNDKLRMQYGNLKMKEAFTKADNVLATAAKCITDVINSRGHIIVDFADVCTVMKNGGVAILGKAEVEGENRAERAIEEALNSPLLNDNDIKGAKWILLNINSAEGDYECSMDELETINNILRARTGEHSDVIMGMGYDETLGEKIGITLIATGFEHKDPFKKEEPKKAEAPAEEKIVMTLVTENAPMASAVPAEAVAEVPVAENIAEEPIVNELENDNHFILDQTSEAAVQFSFAAPAEEVIEEVIEEEVLVDLDEVAELAELTIQAADMQEAYSLTPTMAEEEIVSNVFVSIPDDTEEEAAYFVANEVEEVQEERFELDMEATPAMDFSTEFVINKPANIYAEVDFEEATEEVKEEVEEEEFEEEVVVEAAPIHNYQFESVVETVFAAEAEETPVNEFQSSFRVAEQEEPTMQLVIREETEGTPEPKRSAHPSYDISLDNAEEQRRKVAERIQKLRNLSFNINNSTDPNTEFDAVPAYVRRNLDLFGNTLASVENYYSKYTVEPDENNQAKLSTINTFLDGKKPD
ncbi:MAG: cell division protein FtsZ [Bacteroidota bacterium]|jgi:cell division protein FtsZ